MARGAISGSDDLRLEPDRESILARVPLLVYVIDVGHSRLEFTNDQSLAVLGYKSQVILERGLSFFYELTHPEDLSRVQAQENRWAAARDEETLEIEYRLKHGDGRWCWIRRREVVLARDQDGRVTKILGAADDVTERKVSHRHLVRHHERLLQLLAYDIHDGLVQDVVGAQLALESVLETLAASNPECLQELVVIRGLLCKAINEGRRMISELRPIIIDEMGVIEAIHYLVNEEQAAERLDVHFTHDVQFQRLGPMLEGTIFRIVQESLNNTRRYAGVTEAEVRFASGATRFCWRSRTRGSGLISAWSKITTLAWKGFGNARDYLAAAPSFAASPGQEL